MAFRSNLVSIAFFLLLVPDARSQQPGEGLATQFQQLQKRYEAEADPIVKDTLGRDIDKLQQQIHAREVEQLHEEWVKEADAEKKKELGDQLSEAAIKSKIDGEVLQEAAAEKESLVRVIEVATAGQFEQKGD